MYPDIEDLETEYKEFQKLKKSNTQLVDEFVLFNQQVLTKCGEIHWLCLDHWETGGKEEYKKFITETSSGMYYNDWRKARAVSCAICMNNYKLLNVELNEEHFVGETFYAGIPPVTKQEIDAARIKTEDSEKYQFISCSEKIGTDGKYHPVDNNGDFEWYPYDPSNPYGDK